MLPPWSELTEKWIGAKDLTGDSTGFVPQPAVAPEQAEENSVTNMTDPANFALASDHGPEVAQMRRRSVFMPAASQACSSLADVWSVGLINV